MRTPLEMFDVSSFSLFSSDTSDNIVTGNTVSFDSLSFSMGAMWLSEDSEWCRLVVQNNSLLSSRPTGN